MKRAYIMLFVLAIVALFTNTEVMAIITPPSPVCVPEDPNIPPNCCEFVDFNNAIQGKGLKVLQTGNEWPIPIKDEGDNIVKYKWTYEYLGPLGTGGQIPAIAAIAPLCSYPVNVTLVEVGGPIVPPGKIFYLSSTPPRTVYFYTDKKKIDNMSFDLKIGSTVNICRNIEGPVCAPPGIAVDLLPCNTIVPLSVPDPENPAVLVNLQITKDCTSRCAVKVEQWIGGEWAPITPEEQTEIDGKQLKGCFAPSGDQACQECMIYSTGSPGCYTYSSGGVTYKIPRGCI